MNRHIYKRILDLVKEEIELERQRLTNVNRVAPMLFMAPENIRRIIADWEDTPSVGRQEFLAELKTFLKSKGVLYKQIDSPTAGLDSLSAIESYENSELLQLEIRAAFVYSELFQFLKAEIEDEDDEEEKNSLRLEVKISQDKWEKWLKDAEEKGYIVLSSRTNAVIPESKDLLTEFEKAVNEIHHGR